MGIDTCVICGKDISDLGVQVCYECRKDISDLGDCEINYCLTLEEYQDDAARTVRSSLTNIQQLQEGLMGLNGEAGEAVGLLTKHLFQEHVLDTKHLAKELGDALWYLTEAASALGYNLQDIMLMNIEKRRKRYPEGFKPELSIDRKPEDI